MRGKIREQGEEIGVKSRKLALLARLWIRHGAADGAEVGLEEIAGENSGSPSGV